VPTPTNVVEKMLEAAKLSKDDILYDLGCGDGRIVATAAKKFGLKAKGFDIDPQRIKESKETVKKMGVENLVTIEQRDIFEVDLSPASVVTLYLLPELNVRLIPQLEKLKPGSRVVSHDFDMAGVDPEKWWTVMAPDHRDAKKMREHYVYLWKTPLKKTAAATPKK
jgi:ribosomal protein L11 methylase PrmA